MDSSGVFAYSMDAAVSGSRGAQFSAIFLAQRTSDGWVPGAADPIPGSLGAGFRIQQPLAVSSDSKRVLVSTFADIDPADQDKGIDLYLVDAASGAATWVSHGPDLPDTQSPTGVYFVGASRDLTTVFFRFEGGSLLSGAPDLEMYEWKDGVLSLASVLSDGAPALSWQPAAWAFNRSGFKSPAPGYPAQAHGGAHAVSDDGSTVYFNGTNASVNGLFGRRGEVTRQIGLSQRAGSVGMPGSGVQFVAASHDGDVVYFFSDSQLTDDADNGGGLYRYVWPTAEAPAGVLTLLTPDGVGKNDAGLAVSDAVASDDMSHVYFVATAALADGAIAGQQNLYVYSDGQTNWIATLPSSGTVERVSRSGRFAVIQTTDALAGATTNGHVTLYRYDDETSELACVSCDSDGVSEGDASLEDRGTASFAASPSPVRNIADDGSVFFASSDRLVPADVTPAWDVYEYADTSVRLLSSGRTEDDNYVQDNSDDGTDAYFVTSDSLVPADDDGGLSDVYDARRGGGFPSLAATPPARCVEDCQRTTANPRLPSPASMVAATPPPVVVTPPTPTIVRTVRFGRVTPSMRLKLQRGQTAAIPVLVAGGGRLTLTATARSGGSKFGAGTAVRRLRTVRRVTAHVPLRLSTRARSALRRRGSLRVVLTVRLSGVRTPKHKIIVLEQRGR